MVDKSLIRSVFKRGEIASQNNSVFVRYKGEFADECIKKLDQSKIEFLIAESDSIRLTIDPSKGIYLVFRFPFDVGSSFFDTSISPSIDFDEAMKKLSSIPYKPEMVSRIAQEISADMTPYEMIEKVMEISMELNKSDSIDLPRRMRWERLCREASVFQNISPMCSLERMPPDRYSQVGVLTFFFDAEKRRVIEFSGESKDALLRMVRASDGVDMEFSVDEESSYFSLSVGTE